MGLSATPLQTFLGKSLIKKINTEIKKFGNKKAQNLCVVETFVDESGTYFVNWQLKDFWMRKVTVRIPQDVNKTSISLVRLWGPGPWSVQNMEQEKYFLRENQLAPILKKARNFIQKGMTDRKKLLEL